MANGDGFSSGDPFGLAPQSARGFPGIVNALEAGRAGKIQAGNILRPGGPFDITPGEVFSLEGLESLARGELGGLSTSTLEDILRNSGARFEEFFNTSIRGPALRDFETEILPTLDRELARSGFHGSARATQLQNATEALSNFLTETRAKTALERDQLRLSASQAIPAELGILLSTLAAAGTPRAIEDARVGRLLGLAGTQTEPTEFGGGGGGGGGSSTAAAIQALASIISAAIRP